MKETKFKIDNEIRERELKDNPVCNFCRCNMFLESHSKGEKFIICLRCGNSYDYN